MEPFQLPGREFFIDNLLVRIHFIIVMIRWTGLAPWEFEFPPLGHTGSGSAVRLPRSLSRLVSLGRTGDEPEGVD